MSKVDGMPVNFTICDDGKAAIERFRAEWDANLPSPAAVAVIGWSHVIPDEGPPSDGVFFTFYSEEEYPGIAHGVEEASGVRLVFFITRENYGKFEGKTVDFSETRKFFLRD